MQVKEGNLHLKKIVGIDLDGAAVTRAAKRICTRNSDIFAGKAAPQLELFQADVACEAASFPGLLLCLGRPPRPSAWQGHWHAFPRRHCFTLMDGALPLEEMRRIAYRLFERPSTVESAPGFLGSPVDVQAKPERVN